MSVEKLAAVSGVGRTTIFRAERQHTRPHDSTLKLLLVALHQRRPLSEEEIARFAGHMDTDADSLRHELADSRRTLPAGEEAAGDPELSEALLVAVDRSGRATVLNVLRALAGEPMPPGRRQRRTSPALQSAVMAMCIVLVSCATPVSQLRDAPDARLWQELKYRRTTSAGREMRAILVDRHQHWPADVREAILAGQIHVGWTPEQTLSSWGYPDHRHQSTSSWGDSAMWTYGKYPARVVYVYFGGDGRVESIDWSD